MNWNQANYIIKVLIWGLGFVGVCCCLFGGFGHVFVVTWFFFSCCYIEYMLPINGKQRCHLKYHINRNYFYLELSHNGASGTKIQITVMEIYPFWVGYSFTAGEGHLKRESTLCSTFLGVKQMENSFDKICELAKQWMTLDSINMQIYRRKSVSYCILK